MAPGQNRHKKSDPSQSKDRDALGARPHKPKSFKRKASTNDQKQSSKKKRDKARRLSSSPTPGALPASDFCCDPEEGCHMKKGDMKKDHVKKDGEDSNVKQEGNKQNNRPPFAELPDPNPNEINDGDASYATPQPVRSAADIKTYPCLDCARKGWSIDKKGNLQPPPACRRKKPGQKCNRCSGAGMECEPLPLGLRQAYDKLCNLKPHLDNVQATAEFGRLCSTFSRKLHADDEMIFLLRCINKHVFEMRQEFREHWGLPKLDPSEEFAWSELEGGEDDDVMEDGV